MHYFINGMWQRVLFNVHPLRATDPQEEAAHSNNIDTVIVESGIQNIFACEMVTSNLTMASFSVHLFSISKYASTSAADLDLPSWQCTSTPESDSLAELMKRCTDSKCRSMSSFSLSAIATLMHTNPHSSSGRRRSCAQPDNGVSGSANEFDLTPMLHI